MADSLGLSYIRDLLEDIRERGLERSLPPQIIRYDVPRGTIILDGVEKEVIIFCSNDYLGMTQEVEVMEGLIDAIRYFGTGAGASRLVTGNFSPHAEFEDFIKEFFGGDFDALLFNSGWSANVGVIPSICYDGNCEIFSDELNHASIIDGCRLSRARVNIFRHSDMNQLEDMLKKSNAKLRLVITDAVFSMDGDFARLKDIYFLCLKYGALLYVDEAHAFGIFGNEGKGLSEMLGVSPHIRLFTLSKALGLYGAFIVAQKDIVRLLRSRARSFIFSTALPPFIPRAAIKSIKIMSRDDKRRARVLENSSYLRNKLLCFFPGKKHIPGPELEGSFDQKNQSFDENPNDENPRPPNVDHTERFQSQIIPFVIGDARTTMHVSAKLLDAGFFVQGIRPPSVPRGTSRLRITVTAKHTKDEIDKFVQKLSEICVELKVVPRGT